jgi:hypothetical protein
MKGRLNDQITPATGGPVRITDGRGFAVGMVESTATRECSARNRGEMHRVRGAAGAIDTLVVCRKTAADTYAWVTLPSTTDMALLYVPIGTDPNADRIYFWDDSAGNPAFLTVGSGLAISGTTLATDLDMGYVSGPTVHFILRAEMTTTASEYNWTNMPLAETELGGNTNNRKLVDLTQQTEYLFSTEISQAGTAGAILQLQYTTDLDGSGGWTTMAGTTLSLAAANTFVHSGWDAVPVGANAIVLLRVVGSGGDGAVDPRLDNLMVQFRSEGVQGPEGAAGSGGGGSLVDILMLGGM